MWLIQMKLLSLNGISTTSCHNKKRKTALIQLLNYLLIFKVEKNQLFPTGRKTGKTLAGKQIPDRK